MYIMPGLYMAQATALACREGQKNLRSERDAEDDVQLGLACGLMYIMRALYMA